MSDLFREFIKDVLDMKKKPTLIPKPPNFFSIFLEERKQKPEDTINVLENKHTHIQNMIKELRKELESIDKRLAQPKQPKKKAARRKI